MSSSATGREAVAYLERILDAQNRLVQLQEAQVRLLERCIPAPPPPPPGAGSELATAAGGRAAVELPSLLKEAPPKTPVPTAGLAKENLDASGSESGSEASEEVLAYSAGMLPERLPVALRRLLVCLGVLSPLEISAGWKRAVYQMHLVFVPLSVIVASVITAVRAYLSYVVIGADWKAGDVMFFVLFLYCRLFVILPSIFVWRRQFSPRGATLAFMRCMDECDFHWQKLRHGVRLTWCLSVGSMALLIFDLILRHSTWEVSLAKGSASTAQVLLDLAEDIITVPARFVFVGSHYLMVLTARLHRHDIRCYADGIAKAMESDGVASDVVQTLNEVEHLVSERLRDASTTWVPWMLHEIVFCLALILIGGMFLLAGNDKLVINQVSGTYVAGIGWSSVVVVSSGLIVVLLAPMAAVAETFEYDAVNALNTPSTLKSAQKYFGQQLLPHLKTLDWGFRVGGFIIGQRLLSQISAALLIGVLSSASSALQEEFVSRNVRVKPLHPPGLS